MRFLAFLFLLLSLSSCNWIKSHFSKQEEAPAPLAPATGGSREALPGGAPLTIETTNNSDLVSWTLKDGGDSVATFKVPALEGLRGLCRFYKKGTVKPDAAGFCGNFQNGVMQVSFHSLAPKMEDGSYILETQVIRETFESPWVSQEVRLSSSLNGLAKCQLDLPLEKFVAKANEILPSTSPFKSGTVLSKPTSKVIFANGSAVTVPSLARDLYPLPGNKIILVYRRYVSKSKNTCDNLVVPAAEKGAGETYDCPVMAFNSNGDGICLQATGDFVSHAKTLSNVSNLLAGKASGATDKAFLVTD